MSTPQTPRNEEIPSISGAKTPADPFRAKHPHVQSPTRSRKERVPPLPPSLPAATHRLLNAIRARQAGKRMLGMKFDAIDRELEEARRVVEEILALPPVTGKETPCLAPDPCRCPELKPENRVGKCPAKVIDNFDNPFAEGIGFGLQFLRGDDLVRIAVLLPANPTAAEVKNAIMLLKEAAEDPFAPESKAAINEAILTGNEIDASDPRPKPAPVAPAKEETPGDGWCRKILAREGSQLYAACDSLIREVEGFWNYRDDNGRRLKDAHPWCAFYSAVKAFGRTPKPESPQSVLDAGTLQQAEAWMAAHEAVTKHLAREYAATESDDLNGMEHTVAAITMAAAELRKLQGFYDRIVARFGTDDIFGHVRRLEGEVEIARNDVRLSEGAYAMATANIAGLMGQLKEADAKRESLAKSLLDTVTKGCEHVNLLNVMNAAAKNIGVAGLVVGALCGAGVTFGIMILLK